MTQATNATHRPVGHWWPWVVRARRSKRAEALLSGIVLGVAFTLLLGLLANWLAAALADVALLF